MSKPATQLLPDIETEVERFNMLWLAALVENVNIALGHGAASSSKLNRQRGNQRREAEDWIGSDDFVMVCEFVGIEPSVLLVQIEALRASGKPLVVEVWG